MKAEIFTIFLLISSTFAYSYDPNALFERFIEHYEIEVKNHENFLEKREIFLEKLKKIDAHNKLYDKGKVGYRMGVNKYSHFTREELSNLMGLVKSEGKYRGNFATEHKEFNARGFRAPESFNWNDKGKVTPVQDQKTCGSCYAFSGIAAIESHMMIKFDNVTKLSEQEAMECTKGCEGGHPDMIFLYSRLAKGCSSEDEYPYKGNVQNFCFKDLNQHERVDHSRSMLFKHVSDNEREIIFYLVNKGPLATGMAVYSNFMEYAGGIYTDRGNDDDLLGYHAILLTGYGEENGMKYWIAKNSWSTSWGENGYFRILRGEDLCEFESMTISFPIIKD